MSLGHSPKVVTDGLIFYYDINNSKKSWIGRPTTNTVNALTTGIGRYNNPGFSGGVVNTGQTYNGFPIYKTTFIPQNSTYISRLGSTEGFGAFHGMGIALQANTRYMASILFKSNYPLQNSASQGFSNGYSNIGGWNQNGTTSARYQQDDGWTRLYTQYLNSTNGYSTRTSTFQTNFTVNTTTTETVDLAFTITAGGSGISDFAYLYAIVSASPTIASNGGLTGLSIVNHGLDTTNFTRLSWPSIIELKTDLPLTYYVRVSVPSTGGVNTTIALRANFGGYYTALSDSKYWKVTFDTTNLAVGTEIETFWCCPMIEQHDTVYPSTFVNGTRSNTQGLLDLVGGNNITASGLTYNNDGTFDFNNSNDFSIGNSSNFFPTGDVAHNLSIEMIVNPTVNNRMFFGQFVADNRLYIGVYTDNTWRFGWGTISWAGPYSGGTAITASFNNFQHVCLTVTNGLAKLYVNGVPSIYYTDNAVTLPSLLSFGVYYENGVKNTTYMSSCKIPLGRIYNRSLSDSEVLQNFNAQRARYSI